jgi:hypothetical protein
MSADNSEQKIIKREIITDQNDPRMIEFRKSQGEFNPGHPRKTVRLEITEYEPGPDKFKITTRWGFYEGDPPPEYREFFRKLYMNYVAQTSKESEGKKKGVRMYEKKDFLSRDYETRWENQILYDEGILNNIGKEVKLHTDIRNVRSSAAACINTIGNIGKNPSDLVNFLNKFGLNVQEIIPVPSGATFDGYQYNDSGNVVFEWIGPKRSPLHEKGGRGYNRTSIDAFVLAKIDDKVTQILIEWKFTEEYNSPEQLNKFAGIAGNERLRRYSSCLADLRKDKYFPFNMSYEKGFGLHDLGYEPIYQLLRMTLLAKLTDSLAFDNGLKIEDHKILHLSHSTNDKLNQVSKEHLRYCPGLQCYADKMLHEIWKNHILSKVESGRFHFGYWDRAIDDIYDKELKKYLIERYVGTIT